jgi:hypothetical protein
MKSLACTLLVLVVVSCSIDDLYYLSPLLAFWWNSLLSLQVHLRSNGFHYYFLLLTCNLLMSLYFILLVHAQLMLVLISLPRIQLC